MNSRAFIAFRVLAYATGVMLLLLVFVAMPIKYFGDNGTPVRIIGTTHGWLYIGYVISAFVMAQRLRWGIARTVLLLLAGTIPFMSFVAEHKVRRQVRDSALIQSD